LKVNLQAAAEASSPGLFGYGTPGEFTAPSWAQAKLVYTEAGTYKYTLPDQETFTFNSSGRLSSVSERNVNTTTVTYHEEEVCEGGCHEVLKSIQIADPASRKITLTLNSGGQVESATDPMGHVVKYAYEGGNLKSVTEPGETSPRWQFKYNGSHELTEMTNGVGGHTTNEYNEAHQVVSQTSPLGQKLHFAYEEIVSKEGGDYSFYPVAAETPEEEEDEEEIEYVEVAEGYYVPLSKSETTITNESTGAVEHEHFNSEGELETVTRAAGTPIATTESFTYNSAGALTKAINGDSKATEYGYNAAGDKTSEKNADGDETKWTYDGKHDIETETTPGGETTTIKRNSAGDPEVIERPAPGSTTQKTTYKIASNGDVESMTNPLERTWKYEYDSYGDRKAETDPESNKRTWEYNEDSQETATVSPRGNAAGAKASEFTTKFELNAKGQPLKITDPLSHTTKYTYDGDGNLETVIDGNSHTTKYTYDADNELTKTEEPNKTVTETEYDSMGQVKNQTDGNKHVTKYVRNALEEVEEEVNLLGKKTLKEYDKAGNLVKFTDPAKRTTTYKYDPANRLEEVSYSSGKPATIKYEYNKDGYRTKMTDGTGTTTYTYDQLDRMTESENGHKEVIKYEYNLGNQQTKITYPNTKAVERAYDKDGRLEKVTDWNKKETKFAYDEDSDLKTITFPSETKDVDTYSYNDADQMTEVKMKKNTETIGSLVYTRDSDGQVKKTTSKDLPGAEITENTYDENNRLTKTGTTEHKYDAANNPTTEGSSTNTYNEGDELEKGTGETYAYDELGERTKTTPEKGPATTYGYDQAGNLLSVERPKRRRNLRNQRRLHLQRRRAAHIADHLWHDHVPGVGHGRRTPADPQRWDEQLHLRACRPAD
jgi:YD repeat-containing protein